MCRVGTRRIAAHCFIDRISCMSVGIAADQFALHALTHAHVQEIKRFKPLFDRINEESLIILSRCRLPAKKMINHLISVELAYINTNHPDFIGGSGALGGMFDKLAQVQQEEQRAMQQAQAQSQPSVCCLCVCVCVALGHCIDADRPMYCAMMIGTPCSSGRTSSSRFQRLDG
jgi:hypothetical protein